MNRVDLSNLSDKPFSIVVSRSALFSPAACYICFFLDVVIPIPVWCARNLGLLS